MKSTTTNKVTDNILFRVYLLFGMMLMLAVVILFKVGKIQFFEKDKWESKAVKEKVFFKKIVAARGNILSDNGTILATSQPYYRLSIDPTLINTQIDSFPEQLDQVSKLMAENFGNEEFQAEYFKEKIQAAIESKDRHIFLLKREVTNKEFKMAKTWPLLDQSRFKGGLIGEQVDNKRFYPFKNLARISLGILRDDTLALKGIEYSFNKELRGQDGHVLMQKISGSHAIPMQDLGDSQADDGYDVKTTIDVDLQDITETALMKAVTQNAAKYGVAILMEVKTGYIKAIANLKRNSEGNYYEGINYAYAEGNEPGSTFKLASFLALLEDKAVGVEDSIETGVGFAQYYDRTMYDHLGHGKITVQEGFQLSSNVLTAHLIDSIYGDDPGKFIAWLDQFGLMNKVNSQIIGEPEPVVFRPDDRMWSGTTLPWMSIGYNCSFTPLQILSFYNAIANDGYRVEPIIVSEIKSNSRSINKFNPVQSRKPICSQKSLTVIQQLLQGVVDHGTARRIRSDHYSIAGKTGTAQKVVNGKYEKIYQASFCGYFPADNPKYSCFVLIDEPSNGRFYGSEVAAPVFKSISDQVYSMDLELGKNFSDLSQDPAHSPVSRIVHQPNANRVYEELNISTQKEPEAKWVRVSQDGGTVEYSPFNLKDGIVPNVKGMSGRDALNLLENHGLKVVIHGYGKIRTQSISPGNRFANRDRIVLQLK